MHDAARVRSWPAEGAGAHVTVVPAYTLTRTLFHSSPEPHTGAGGLVCRPVPGRRGGADGGGPAGARAALPHVSQPARLGRSADALGAGRRLRRRCRAPGSPCCRSLLPRPRCTCPSACLRCAALPCRPPRALAHLPQRAGGAPRQHRPRGVEPAGAVPPGAGRCGGRPEREALALAGRGPRRHRRIAGAAAGRATRAPGLRRPPRPRPPDLPRARRALRRACRAQVYQSVVAQLGPDHPGHIEAVVALADLHRELGQQAEAERCAQAAEALGAGVVAAPLTCTGSWASRRRRSGAALPRGCGRRAAGVPKAWSRGGGRSRDTALSTHSRTPPGTPPSLSAHPPSSPPRSVLGELEQLIRSQDTPADHAAAYEFVLRRANVLYACGKNVSGKEERRGGGQPAHLARGGTG